MTREDLLSHAHAGRTLRDTAALLGTTKYVVQHWCRVHRIDWYKERRKHPRVAAAYNYALALAQHKSTEKRKCQEFPK